MFRQKSPAAFVVIVAISLVMPGCGNQAKDGAVVHEAGTGGTAQALPATLTVDLGKGVKLELILISPGEFLMGSLNPQNDMPGFDWQQHRVRITKPFYLGKYPVTQEQWQAMIGDFPNRQLINTKGPKNPAECVERKDWERFVKKLNASFTRPEGQFALPTEAQWEYACRAGTTTKFYFGDDESKLGDYAWYNSNSGMKSHPVGEKKPNAWGLYDMSGNVSELCADAMVSYKKLPEDDPVAPYDVGYSVRRGGGWSGAATCCRSTFRAVSIYPGTGFRVALVLSEK
jgi:formylglycine-generating enzyme required for sulfatase activity